MDIRNVQKSGNTYYLYLPAHWCRQHGISTDSKLVLDSTTEGDLVIKPHQSERPPVDLKLNLRSHDMAVVNKFIVGAYLNPAKSFNIKLDKEVSSLEILDQKRLLGGIEIVEFGGKHISCESAIQIDDPDIMLKTMVRKLSNMLHVMMKDANSELLGRYEEEIDRSNTLITKSAVSALMFRKSSRLRNIELHYIATMSKSLEWFADQLIHLAKHPTLAKKAHELMGLLQKTLENLSIPTATEFAKAVIAFRKSVAKTKNLNLELLQMASNQCADIVVDWAITKEIETT